ncbi:MAG: tetratricopeptide repeat protein [Pyrinomonadaceae bacterium]
MQKNALTSIVMPVVILIAGFAAVFALTGYVEAKRPPLPEGYADADLNMNGSSLRGYAFGTEGLIADFYFMRSLQYVGDKLLSQSDKTIDLNDLRGLNPRLLYPMLENATDLDPHFIAAYSYGAVVLPAIDPQKAIELANKGIVNNPEHWRLYQHLGYIYWRLGQFEKASEIYEKGSNIAGASPFMRMMAASMKTEGGSRHTARAIYIEMLATSEDEQVKITADRSLKELDSMDERDAIDKVLGELKQQNTRCVNSLSEILPMLRGVKLPEGRDFRLDSAGRLVDPSGAPYLFDKETCRVKLDPERTGLPVK